MRIIYVAHVADDCSAEADLVVISSVVSTIEELGEAVCCCSRIGSECSIGVFGEISNTGFTRMFSKSDVGVDFGVEDEVVSEWIGLVALVVEELEFKATVEAISVGEVGKHNSWLSLKHQADIRSRWNHSHFRYRTGDGAANQDGK